MKKVLLVLVLIATLGGVTWLIVHIWQLHISPIPSSISKKASFSIFYPQSQISGLLVNKKSLTYDTANFGLAFSLTIHSKEVDITEQNSPDIFNQAGVYSYKLDQSHEYDSFTSTSGEVALTKPDDLRGQTLAWVNSKGTLLLARALQPLSKDEWMLLFNNMYVVK